MKVNFGLCRFAAYEEEAKVSHRAGSGRNDGTFSSRRESLGATRLFGFFLCVLAVSQSSEAAGSKQGFSALEKIHVGFS